MVLSTTARTVESCFTQSRLRKQGRKALCEKTLWSLWLKIKREKKNYLSLAQSNHHPVLSDRHRLVLSAGLFFVSSRTISF